MKANETLQDNAIAVGLRANQLSNQEAKRAHDLLARAHQEAADLINAQDLTRYQQSRLRHLMGEIEHLTGETWGKIYESTIEQGDLLGPEVATRTMGALDRAVGVELGLPTPDPASLVGLARDARAQGKPLEYWWRQQPAAMAQRYGQQIALGALEGETTPQIVARVMDPQHKILQATRHQATTLVRTSLNHTANRAMELTYGANRGMISHIQHLSTLDGRTSPICVARSGLRYRIEQDGRIVPDGHDTPYGGGAPYHPNCRSVMVPVTKSWEELSGKKLTQERTYQEALQARMAQQGKSPAQIRAATQKTRSSMDGQVPQDLTMEEWLRGRPESEVVKQLGQARARAFLDGKITLPEMLSRDGLLLSQKATSELARLDPRAIATAKPDPATRFPAWKKRTGKTGTRNGTKWTLGENPDKRVLVEMSPEEIRRLARWNTVPDRATLQAIQPSTPLQAPRINYLDTGEITIDQGAAEILWATQQGHETILVAVTKQDRTLREIAATDKAMARLRGGVRTPEHPLGVWDTIAEFDKTPIRTRASDPRMNGMIGARVKKGQELTQAQKEWTAAFDGMPSPKDFGEQYRNIYTAQKTGLMPDEAAQIAFDRGLIPEPTVDALWIQIQQDASTRRRLSKRALAAQELEGQDIGERLDALQGAFERELLDREPLAGINHYLDPEMINIGDAIQAEGDWFFVLGREQDGSLILRDGDRWGEELLWPTGKRMRAQGVVQDTMDYSRFVPESEIALEAAREQVQELARIQSEIHQDLAGIMETLPELEGASRKALQEQAWRAQRQAGALEAAIQSATRQLDLGEVPTVPPLNSFVTRERPKPGTVLPAGPPVNEWGEARDWTEKQISNVLEAEQATGVRLSQIEARFRDLDDGSTVKLTAMRDFETGDPAGVLVLDVTGSRDSWKATRVLTRKPNGGWSVEHNYFSIDTDKQGRAVGKQVLGAFLDVYDEIGVEDITLLANIDVGGYAWARYGFRPTQESWDKLRENMIETIHRIPEESWEEWRRIAAIQDPGVGFDELLEMPGKAKAWRSFAPEPGQETSIPKAFLLGSSWKGSLRLSDQASWGTFKEYLDSSPAGPLALTTP